MTDFDIAFDKLMEHEGGYVNNTADKGGATNYGITQAVARANGYTGDMRYFPKSTAKKIYYNQYWILAKCHKMPFSIGFNLFDAVVNHGIGNGVRMLQRAVGVADDGIIGNITLNAVKNSNELEAVIAFNAERLAFYTKLSNFKTFGKGWVNRIAGNLKFTKNL